jgi:hypothetical protein
MLEFLYCVWDFCDVGSAGFRPDFVADEMGEFFNVVRNAVFSTTER